MQLHIVHLNKNEFQIGSAEYNESVRREKSFLFEMLEQDIDFKVWDAIYNPKDGKEGCCRSHNRKSPLQAIVSKLCDGAPDRNRTCICPLGGGRSIH